MKEKLFAPKATVCGLIVICLAASCASYRNEELSTYDTQSGYRFEDLEPGENNSDSVFIYLAFSGGGTRAAAFAYGVLQGLRETSLGSGTALDEVDIISSVSGGSFTAIGYGLWRDQLFDGHFENRFLRHNVQGDLLARVLNPVNWLLKPDSGDMAANYYDKYIFRGATYGDVLADKRRPFVVLNATDLAREEQFQFTQETFDLLGSDLSKLRVAWAAASSSAFPIAFDPLRFKYFPGDAMAAAIRDTLSGQQPSLLHDKRRLWAQSLLVAGEPHRSADVQIDEDNHKYMYLADGGLVDNLGMSYFFKQFRAGAIRHRIEQGKTDHVVVILVDAGTESPNKLEHSSSTPGKLFVGVRSATSGLYTVTWLMTTVSKYVLLEAEPAIRKAYEECRETIQAHYPDVTPPETPPERRATTYLVDLNFHRVKDATKRQRLLTMPTSFALEDEQVDELIEAGRTLVSEHPELRRLMENIR